MACYFQVVPCSKVRLAGTPCRSMREFSKNQGAFLADFVSNAQTPSQIYSKPISEQNHWKPNAIGHVCRDRAASRPELHWPFSSACHDPGSRDSRPAAGASRHDTGVAKLVMKGAVIAPGFAQYAASGNR